MVKERNGGNFDLDRGRRDRRVVACPASSRGAECRVTVLEKTPKLMPIGAGIIIMNPNAMRVLERTGLADELRLESWPYLLRETCERARPYACTARLSPAL
jgi:hypothetical protein